jgi:RNA polymerase sigma factor (sigma-70 family)
MHTALTEPPTAAQDREIATWVSRERGRLLAYIRHQVRDASEAEDVLQETLYELLETYRLLKPVEQVGAWLRRVARNRLIDLSRRSRPALLADLWPLEPEDGAGNIEDLLPSPEDGPEASLVRERLLQRVAKALDELPPEQREVFVAQELEGASFKELADRWQVSINTLLARKRYAVLHLRKTLRAAYEEWLSDQG